MSNQNCEYISVENLFAYFEFFNFCLVYTLGLRQQMDFDSYSQTVRGEKDHGHYDHIISAKKQFGLNRVGFDVIKDLVEMNLDH